MNNLQAIIGDYQAFLNQIIKEITQAGFDWNDFVQMDHLCYRVSTQDDYEQKKQALNTVAAVLSETLVNGRPITTFRLHQPIFYDRWRIDAVELPAPKSGIETKEGLEHIELVLFDDIQTFLQKYADKQFELQAADRGVNPEVGFQLPSYMVKFHLLNLPTAVYLQKKLGIKSI
jgi:predicted metalloenzyme YecM